jgi:Sulfatase
MSDMDTASPAARAAADGSRDWRFQTWCAALLVTLAEAILLQRKHGLFTGGFLAATPLGTWLDCVAFLGVLFLLNATVAAPMCAAALIAGRAVRLRPWALRFVGFAAGSVPILTADFLLYQLWSFLGDKFDFNLMFQLTGRRVSEIFAVAAPLVARPLSIGLVVVVALLATTWVINRIQRDVPTAPAAPAPLAAVRASVALALISAVITMGVALSSDSMTYGLRSTPVGDVAVRLLDRLTDFDRDGYGLLRTPRDTAPFDARIHPYALEIPGNGIDENGIGGDLPLDRATYQEPPPPNAAWPARPPVILFVLESFRADAVGASYGGRAVTPVMDGLARRGVKVESAWSHNGFTRQSRFHILSGSMTGRRGTSLLDDFKNHGYEVAYFSAQDDSAFGGDGIDYARVDKYYDARQDIRRRYTAYTTPGSLAVPFNVLEEHIGGYLRGRRPVRPLFLYVNFHDTHYPYNHAGLKNILGGDPLPASLISAGRRGDLWRTYLNAAANVDAAIGRVIEAVRANVGVSPAVVVISDHGESLFDGGFLGHGYALNAAQTRIPMIVAGLPMRISVPFGQARLRDALNEALAGSVALDVRPAVDTSREVRVFQYLGPLETPGQIGWLTAEGQLTYDFRTNRVGLWDSIVRPDALVGEPRSTFTELVHLWESMQLAAAARHFDPSAAALR